MDIRFFTSAKITICDIFLIWAKTVDYIPMVKMRFFSGDEEISKIRISVKTIDEEKFCISNFGAKIREEAGFGLKDHKL